MDSYNPAHQDLSRLHTPFYYSNQTKSCPKYIYDRTSLYSRTALTVFWCKDERACKHWRQVGLPACPLHTLQVSARFWLLRAWPRKCGRLPFLVEDVPAAETCNVWRGQAALLGACICSLSRRYIRKLWAPSENIYLCPITDVFRILLCLIAVVKRRVRSRPILVHRVS